MTDKNETKPGKIKHTTNADSAYAQTILKLKTLYETETGKKPDALKPVKIRRPR